MFRRAYHSVLGVRTKTSNCAFRLWMLAFPIPPCLLEYMFRVYARNTIVIPIQYQLWVSFESLQFGVLILHWASAYMKLVGLWCAGILIHAGVRLQSDYQWCEVKVARSKSLRSTPALQHCHGVLSTSDPGLSYWLLIPRFGRGLEAVLGRPMSCMSEAWWSNKTPYCRLANDT